MKKLKAFILIYMVLFLVGANLTYQQEVLANNDPIVIPKEAIRLRILANSDSDHDQALKRLVRDRVNEQINLWVEKLTSIEAARDTIRGNLPEIERIVDQVLAEQGQTINYKVEFQKVAFPTKVYGNFVYPAGTYEAVLITLGEGKGANWWCVLFPPLCFLDFSNGEAVAKDKSPDKDIDEQKPKVRFFFVDFFKDLFKKWFA